MNIQPDSVFKQAAIEAVTSLINESNEWYRDYNLNHEDSGIREFVASFSYGDAMPDWKTVKEQLGEGLFAVDSFNSGAFDALLTVIDNSNERLQDKIVLALIEAAEIDMGSIYTPSGAILNSHSVGELETQVPDEAEALIKLWGITNKEMCFVGLEYYIDSKLKYSYIDCTYDVCRLMLTDADEVLQVLSEEISDSL